MEHLSINGENENKVTDRTVTKIGFKDYDKTGIKCKWELNALPEYLEDDTGLSGRVMDDVVSLLEERELKDITVELAEGYDNEDQGKEHYRFKMVFGNGSDNKKLLFSEHYSADTEEGEIKGSVRAKVGLLNDSIEDHKDLEKNIADIYIKRMEETYTDWKNQWEDGYFDNIS
ncbi:MAG: hypothetical protein WCG91_03365 [Candidatus Shapirobacteria bacterium]